MARIAHCRIGIDRFAIDLNVLLGIERTDRLQLAPPEPGSDATAAIGWLLGTEEDVPVFSLARRLGLPNAGRATRHAGAVLLCAGRAGAGRSGLLVDRIDRSERPAETIHPLPEALLRAGISGFGGVVEEAGTLSLLVDLAAMAAGERERDATDAKDPRDREDAKDEKDRGDARVPTAGGARRASRVLIADLLARDAQGRRMAVAFALAQVAEVVEALPILTVPGAPPRFSGLILWRDRPVVVLDLAGGLSGVGKLTAFDRPSDRFVIVNVGREPVAVAVGRDVRFERFPLADPAVVRAPEAATRGVLGDYDLSDSRLLVFDLSRSLAGADLA